MFQFHEHDSSAGFFQEYWDILTDPAHLAAELTMTLVDILILSPLLFVFWKMIKSQWNKAIHRAVVSEHQKIDAEHGVRDHSHDNID